MSNDLRILFITHGNPFPVRSGGHMYTANVIRTLSNRADVALTVVAVGTEDTLANVPPGADWHVCPEPWGSGIVRGLLGKYPRSTAATYSSAYRRRLRALLTGGDWNVVVVDYIAIGWVLGDVTELTAHGDARIVYLSHNVESSLRQRIAEGYVGPAPLRWLALRDARKAARLEESIVRSSDLITAETDEDASEFRALYGVDRIHKYTPGYDGHVAGSRSVPLSDSQRSVALIGSRIATMKRLVLDEILATIASPLRDGRVGIVVAGEAPSDYIAARSADYPYVDFRGYVDDLAPLLESVRFGLITDHIGGGFKHRILTLAFNRVPIVATREAMAGLPFEPGVHYLEVKGNGDVPDVVMQAIEDYERLEGVQHSAFEACRQVFDWDSSTNGFVAALTAASVDY